MPDPLTRPQIRDNLTTFAARWSQRRGNEKSEAQTYLGELLDCYGTEWRDKIGTEIRFEHHYAGGGYADLLWKGNVLVEMKSKSQREALIAQSRRPTAGRPRCSMTPAQSQRAYWR